MSEESKFSEWQHRLARFRKSGSSVSAFCRKERVSVPSFYQWRKRLSVGSNGPSVLASGFAPVRLVASASLIVQLRGGTQLQIPAGDPQTMQVAIAALVRADAAQAGGESC